MRSLKDGDIAYLWPAASLNIHKTLHDRGVPIVLEAINTRMASAKRILDDAYEELAAIIHEAPVLARGAMFEGPLLLDAHR